MPTQAEIYRAKADELRKRAETVKEDMLRDEMLATALQFDRLAQESERSDVNGRPLI